MPRDTTYEDNQHDARITEAARHLNRLHEDLVSGYSANVDSFRDRLHRRLAVQRGEEPDS